MKILGTIFRLFCALVVLLAIVTYLSCPPHVTLADYLAAFAPANLQQFMNLESSFAIAAGALLLLTLCSGIKLGWNIVYSMATLVFFAGLAIMLLGPEEALPAAIRGHGWEPLLREVSLNYPVPTLLVPMLCIFGCLCCSAPVRIALRSLLACLLCFGCAELLHYGLQQWKAMPEPFMPDVLEMVRDFRWILFALPAVFFVQYCLFMSIFETFIPAKKKDKTEKEEKANEKESTKETGTDTPSDKAVDKQPAATPAPVVTKVVVKRPVVHKKNPVSPDPAEEKKPEELKPEETKEEAPAEAPKAETPTEEEKPGAPAEEKKPEAEAKPESAEAEVSDPADKSAEEESTPKPIPSVPLPANEAS